MAKQKQKAKPSTETSTPDAESTMPEAPHARRAEPAPGAARKKRRDLRPFIYAGLDVIFCVVYLFSVLELSPNRHPWAQALLLCLPLSAGLMAVGTLVGALVKDAKLARVGWIVAVAGATSMLVVTVVLLALLLASAAFLSGVYGAIGKGAASGVLAAAALIVEVCGILPAFQLKYLMTRGGRRAFGLTPLWSPA
jgi:hypothetical protein